MEGCVGICRWSYWWTAVAILDIILFWYRFVIFNINSSYVIVCSWLIWIFFLWCSACIVFEYIVVPLRIINMFLLCFVWLMSPVEMSFLYANLGEILLVLPLLLFWSEFEIVICDMYLFNSFLAAGWSIIIFHHVIFTLPYLFINNLWSFIHWFVYSRVSFDSYCLVGLKCRW